MKVYIASKFSDKERTREAHKLLKSAGHEITHDWTNNVQSLPFSSNPEYTSKCAFEDINGVLQADIFILLSSSEPSMGASAELGAAIAKNLANENSKIYVVGPHFDKNFCFYHPVVHRVETIEDVLKDLNTIFTHKLRTKESHGNF